MKTSSAKAKGRRLQQKVRDLLLETFTELEPDDIRSTSMGVSGEDLQLSPAARKLIPFAIECKNQEQLNIWKSMEQAESNCEGLTPLLVFKRNGTKIYAALEISDFLNLLDGNKKETN